MVILITILVSNLRSRLDRVSFYAVSSAFRAKKGIKRLNLPVNRSKSMPLKQVIGF